MAAITSGNFPKALLPGVKSWYGAEYDLPTYYKMIFDQDDSDKAYEEFVEYSGLGLAVAKAEGAAISYDSHTQGPTTRLTHSTYGLGFIITEEAIDDNQYTKLAKSRSKMLGRALRQTKEIVHANHFNRAFDSNYVGGDGKEMVATDHPTVNGTQSNELAVAADLSEVSLEDINIQIMNATDTRGNRIGLKAKRLIVAPAETFNAERILKSNLRSNSAENDINAMKSKGLFPEGIMTWPFLTASTDDWFVETDAPEGLKTLQRKVAQVKDDNDFDTSNARFKAQERYVSGWVEWRRIYGSAGA